jgi:hypothetical protein
MSDKNLSNILELAKKQSFYFAKGQISNEILNLIEKKLELKLSPQHKLFYQKVGYLSFNGFEFYGVCNDTFTGKDDFCAIETTIRERKLNNLPMNWVIFSFLDDGAYAYIDYSRTNLMGEPKIIVAVFNGASYEFIKIICEDIMTFIHNHFKK